MLACFVRQEEDSNWYKYEGCHLSRDHKHLAPEQWSYFECPVTKNLFTPSRNFEEIIRSEQQVSLLIGKIVSPWIIFSPEISVHQDRSASKSFMAAGSLGTN